MIDVAVLGGGPSAEREISLRSAAAVAQALPAQRFRVTPIRVESDGRFLAGSIGDESLFTAPHDRDRRPPSDEAGRVLCGWLESARGDADSEAQVVFPALHGSYGEDGVVQGLLLAHRVAFVGSSVGASALALDKVTSRQFVQSLGLPVAPAVLSLPPHQSGLVLGEVAERLGWPVFAKLDSSGSSLGVERVDSADRLAAFLDSAGLHRVIIEAALDGLEVSVPVLGNRGESLRVLTPVGIRPKGREFFDHTAKYDPSACEEIVPPPGVDPELIHLVQDLARTAHRLVGCDGVSRSDFILTEDGPVFLEINTIPGLTEESLLPKCAAHDGLPFSELCALLVELALRAERPEACFDRSASEAHR